MIMMVVVLTGAGSCWQRVLLGCCLSCLMERWNDVEMNVTDEFIVFFMRFEVSRLIEWNDNNF